MALHGLVAAAGAVSQHIRVADQDRAAPGLKGAFRLTEMKDPADLFTSGQTLELTYAGFSSGTSHCAFRGFGPGL